MNKEIKNYIESFPEEIRNKLIEIYEIINEVVSKDTTEKISWQMPTFYLNGNLVHFAAQKHHIGFYPGPSGIENFTNQFEKNNLKYSKGGVQFKYIDILPKKLIQEIVKFRVKENTFSKKVYEYKTNIIKNPEMDAAYIIFPFDIRKEFGKGRVKIHALFDKVKYDGCIVNMGLKDYIIGINKNVRKNLSKTFGDEISVKVWERK